MKIDFDKPNHTTSGYAPIDTHIHKKHTTTASDTTPPPAQPPAAPGPLDLEAAKNELAPFREAAKREWEWASDLEIKTDEDLIEASNRMLKCAKTFKKIDDKRMQITKPAREFTGGTNSLFKGVSDYLSEPKKKTGAKELIGSEIGRYEYQKEMDRRKAEKKAQDAADKLQEKIDAEAKELDIKPVQMPTMVIPKQQGPVRTERGSVSSKMVWTWEAEDPKKVPRGFLAIDPKRVDAAVTAGIREIPGIKIYEKVETRGRTA